MSISNANATKLNKAMRANQNVSLGTIIQGLQNQAITSGSLAVSAAQSNASAVVITTGVASPIGAIVGIYRSGSMVSSDPYVLKSSGSLTVSKGSTYVVTTGDVINYLVI